MSDSVQIPKRALGALVGGLVLSLMGTCFLLGRVTAPVPVVTVTPSVVPPPAVVPSSQELAVSNPPPPTPTAPKLPPFASKEAGEVRTYLAAVDAIGAGTQDLGNPSDFANELLNQAVMGDASGVDSLLAQARASQAALAKVKVPESCKAHYRLLSGEMRTSIEILQTLKTALETSDSLALAGMAGKGAAAQRQARELEKLTAELRERSAAKVGK
jgi:hypothetical protein